jgi:hypothetical protein
VAALCGLLAVMVGWRLWLFRRRPAAEFEELPDTLAQMQLGG